MVGISAFTKYGQNNKDEASKTLITPDPVDQNIADSEDPTNTMTQPNLECSNHDCHFSPKSCRRSPNGQRQRSNCCRRFHKCTIFIMVLLVSLALTCTIRQMLRVWFAQSSASYRTTVFVYDGISKRVTWPDPPPHTELAAVARYVMHISEWGSLSTYSTHKGIEGYPFVNVFSVSDGPVWNSTGVPYFFLTSLELSVKDIEVNNKVSFTVSEAQSDYCNKNDFDPEDPRCVHIIFTGTVNKVQVGSEEEKFAKLALFSRHSEMKDWPIDHNWFFAKLDIVHIYVLDYFGGVGIVSPKDYFAANPFRGMTMANCIH